MGKLLIDNALAWNYFSLYREKTAKRRTGNALEVHIGIAGKQNHAAGQ
jgi:hypothetical protein